jgi:hypothetical protein
MARARPWPRADAAESEMRAGAVRVGGARFVEDRDSRGRGRRTERAGPDPGRIRVSAKQAGCRWRKRSGRGSSHNSTSNGWALVKPFDLTRAQALTPRPGSGCDSDRPRDAAAAAASAAHRRRGRGILSLSSTYHADCRVWYQSCIC